MLEARAQGNDAIVMVHGDQPGQDLANLDTLLSRGVGGVVMVRSARTTPEEEDTLREKNSQKPDSRGGYGPENGHSQCKVRSAG